MKLLCVSAPLVGHLDWGGYLPTAAELVRRGHNVFWASGPAVAQLVRAAGPAFAELGATGWRWPPPPPLRPADMPAGSPPGAFARLRATRALDQWLEPGRVVAAVEALTALIEQLQPDLIVSEMFILAAGLAAERAGVPFAVAGWPAHAPGVEPAGSSGGQAAAMTAEARKRLASVLAQTGLRGRHVAPEGPPALLSATLHLSFWSPAWFSGAQLLPQTQHVGGLAPAPLPPDPSLPHPDERPWVFITLGTSFADDPAFFRMAVEATRRLGALPVVATGGSMQGAGALVEAGAVVRAGFDLRMLLPYCAAAIHHGGAGTTHALVLAGLPQLVAPHAGDQARQALGVQRTGVGISMRPAEVEVEGLTRALALLLPDRAPTRAAAQRLRAEFAALGGIPRAADLLEAAALPSRGAAV
jgi:UDP:flavonoid glycosyltransferase YjiC (YdhE family)